MFICAVVAGVCGSWLVEEWYNKNIGIEAPVLLLILVIAFHAWLAFVAKSPIEREMDLVYDARLIEQKARNNHLQVATEKMYAALQDEKMEKFREFQTLFEELKK